MTQAARTNPIVVTAGEPAGIGPDLCIELAHTKWAGQIVVVGDPDMLQVRADLLKRDVVVTEYTGSTRPNEGQLQVLSVPLNVPARCGSLNPENSKTLLTGIERAVSGCQSGEFSALVTAPLQKSAIIDAGVAFTGHTEFLAALTGVSLPVMLLVADELRVALASTHMPLKDVASYLSREKIVAVLEVLHLDLMKKFGIENPRILVCGLNPHAGENGHLGTEDRDVILPAVLQCRKSGMDIEGPLPADTVFTPVVGHADAILAMYHDQGLPVIKYAGFGNAVNVTLGLPVIRTSVDHGTALDLAGKGRADCGSMIAAVALASELSGKTDHEG